VAVRRQQNCDAHPSTFEKDAANYIRIADHTIGDRPPNIWVDILDCGCISVPERMAEAIFLERGMDIAKDFFIGSRQRPNAAVDDCD
jgi:hypothetical protein